MKFKRKQELSDANRTNDTSADIDIPSFQENF